MTKLSFGGNNMDKHIRFPCIDDIDIPNTVIINCRKIYEDWGKTKVYQALDEFMYRYDHKVVLAYNRPMRYLNLYRQAYLQSKIAFEGISSDDIDDHIMHKPEELNVDKNKYCKYCGRHLIFPDGTKPTITTNLTYSYTEEEYAALEGAITFDLPKEAYGEKYRDVYTYQFIVNGTVLGTAEAVVPDGTNKFVLAKHTLSVGENLITIISVDHNEYAFELIPYCNNANCFSVRKFDNIHRWQFVNYNATVPVLDTGSVGYVSKTGFRLDDYDYDYKYTDGLMTMEKRGSGLGVPRTFRFDFEYRFIENVPNYRKIYENILYTTFRKSLYSAITRGLDSILQPNEIDMMILMAECIDDSRKLAIADFIHDFMSFFKTYRDTRPTESSEQLVYDEKRQDLLNRLIDFHDLYVLPIEFMSLFFVSVSQSFRTLVYSDSLGGISSKLYYGNKIFPSTSITTIGISKKHNKPFVDTCYVDGLIHSVSDSGVILHDNYYLLIDEDFGMEIFSFMDTSWVEDSSLNISSPPFEVTSKFLKIKILEFNDAKKGLVVFEDGLAMFDFTNNTWVDFGESTYIIKPNGISDIVDVDYLPRTNLFVISDRYRLVAIDKANVVKFEYDCSLDYETYQIETNDEDTCVEISGDHSHLNDIDKVFVNQSVYIKREDNSSEEIDYVTIANTSGDIQILKITMNSNVSVFKTIKFNNVLSSKISSMFYISKNQKLFIAYENKRILVLDTNIFNPVIIQSGDNNDEKLVYATKTKSRYMEYMTYVTNKNDSKYAFAFYQKGMSSVSNAENSMRYLITEGSNIVTYDDIIVYPNNLKFWTSDLYKLSSLQQKERFATQR